MVDLYPFKPLEKMVDNMNSSLCYSTIRLQLGKWKDKVPRFRNFFKKDHEVIYCGSFDLILPHELRICHLTNSSRVGSLDVEYGYECKGDSQVYGKVCVKTHKGLPLGQTILPAFRTSFEVHSYDGSITRSDEFRDIGGGSDFLRNSLFLDSCFIEDSFSQN